MAALEPQRLVVVDDDRWMLRGRSAWLAEIPGIKVLATLSHAEALSFEHWDECDVAVVDAWDESEHFDRFPGVRVVEEIRRRRPGGTTLIVVISGHALDDMLRLRMAEAGADFFYGHSEVRDPGALLSVIQDPDEARRITPGKPDQLAGLGLSARSQPNAALRFISETGMEEIFAQARPQKDLPLSRRGIITARRRLAALAKLSPTRPVGATKDRAMPEWRAITRFVNWARGAWPPPPGEEPARKSLEGGSHG